MPSRLKILTAFGIIYFVWGSTFFAIRVDVLEIAPLLLAAIRFGVAGAVMCAWALARGERLPSRRQWGSIALLAFLIFLLDYGLLFSAERRVASGMAAVILATIPAFTAIGEIIWLRTQRLTPRPRPRSSSASVAWWCWSIPRWASRGRRCTASERSCSWWPR